MTYTEQGDNITLGMSQGDFDFLLVLLGIATGTASRNEDRGLFWQAVRFLNAMNAENPHFQPYEIPAEFAAAVRSREDPHKPTSGAQGGK